MFLDHTHLLIGMADRTDEKGVAEIKEQLKPYGYKVIGVGLKQEYLHLDMCFNQVDEHLAITYRDGMGQEVIELAKKLEIELIPVTEESIFAHGCNLQSLGEHRVISLKKNQGLNEILAKKGMEVIELDITEILKAGGGPHCMTFPLERI